MNKFFFLSLLGLSFNIFIAAGIVVAFFDGLYFPQIITLFIARAGIISSFNLLCKQPSSLFRARYQLICSAMWTLFGNLLNMMFGHTFQPYSSWGLWDSDIPILGFATILAYILPHYLIWRILGSSQAIDYVSRGRR